jgi:hypothetical protein
MQYAAVCDFVSARLNGVNRCLVMAHHASCVWVRDSELEVMMDVYASPSM